MNKVQRRFINHRVKETLGTVTGIAAYMINDETIDVYVWDVASIHKIPTNVDQRKIVIKIMNKNVKNHVILALDLDMHGVTRHPNLEASSDERVYDILGIGIKLTASHSDGTIVVESNSCKIQSSPNSVGNAVLHVWAWEKKI